MQLPSTSRQQLPALLALLLLTVIWGYNWVVMKTALRDIGPFQFAAIRTFFGALVLFMVMRISKRSLALRAFPTMLLLGMLQNVGFTGVLLWALVEGGAGKTAVLTYTMPFWVLLFAWPMLGERVHGWQWLAVVAAVLGMLCIFDPLHLKADRFSMGLALLSGISWALSAIVTKRLQLRQPDMDMLSLTAWPMLLGSLPMVAMACWLPAPAMQWSPYLIGALLFNVLLCGALAWLLWIFALQSLPAGLASMASMLAPVIGVIAAWVQLGEVPDPLEQLGMVLIVASLVLISWLMLKPAPHAISERQLC